MPVAEKPHGLSVIANGSGAILTVRTVVAESAWVGGRVIHLAEPPW